MWWAIFGSNEALAALGKFIKDELWKQAAEPAADSGPGSAVVKGMEGLVAKHLTPASGAKHIPMFMERLPQLYSHQSVPILDAEGRFDTGSKKLAGLKWPPERKAISTCNALDGAAVCTAKRYCISCPSSIHRKMGH